jgi:hypothetical protein
VGLLAVLLVVVFITVRGFSREIWKVNIYLLVANATLRIFIFSNAGTSTL